MKIRPYILDGIFVASLIATSKGFWPAYILVEVFVWVSLIAAAFMNTHGVIVYVRNRDEYQRPRPWASLIFDLLCAVFMVHMGLNVLAVAYAAAAMLLVRFHHLTNTRGIGNGY